MRNDGLNSDYSNIIIVNEDDFTVDNLINFVEGNNHVGLDVSASDGSNFIETYKVNDTTINRTDWHDIVAYNVYLWLDENISLQN